MTSPASASRFELIRPLGAGTLGVVYEALDHDRGTRVAVKTLRNQTAESIARLEREFRAVQGVRHPNLVTLGEFVRDGQQWFLTMELVEGTDFLEYVRPSCGGAVEPRADESRLRDGLRQIAEALSALHETGLVHRDVKPANVRVTREGRVVLLDFGLVIDVAADTPWTDQTAGTPTYMAPEQAVSAVVGPEADWYSLGVLLFEALTGRVPFEGRPLQIVTRKQTEEMLAPSAVRSDIPADLDVLCAALLRIDPRARPKGRHVLRALGSHDARARPCASQAQDTPFIGRADELEALAAALRDSRAGHPVTVVVKGNSGVGKTTLAERFGQRVALEDPNAAVMGGRCYAESDRPFQGVRCSSSTTCIGSTATVSRCSPKCCDHHARRGCCSCSPRRRPPRLCRATYAYSA
ncbi:MAG TPA: serine/threonine-protein kinase [Polyangiaceae bacterium]|nr:serine/threonine-protein kinase [Polyangiaceae bacterium]